MPCTVFCKLVANANRIRQIKLALFETYLIVVIDVHFALCN